MRRVILIALASVLSILTLPSRGQTEPVSIDNAYVRLVIDEGTGTISELTWKGGSEVLSNVVYGKMITRRSPWSVL